MGIREQAAADFRHIVEDEVTGFGWPVTIVSPAGVATEFRGLSTDVSTTIDPETGIPVVGRRASVAVSRAALRAANVAPRQVSNEDADPWVVRFADSAGVTRTYKVIETLPDRTLDALVLILEFFAPL